MTSRAVMRVVADRAAARNEMAGSGAADLPQSIRKAVLHAA